MIAPGKPHPVNQYCCMPMSTTDSIPSVSLWIRDPLLDRGLHPFPEYDPSEPMVIKRSLLPDAPKECLLVAEMEYLLAMKHPHILPIRGTLIRDAPVLNRRGELTDQFEPLHHLILPAASGDLRVMAMSLSPNQARRFLVEILLALEFMHASGIVHGDIKPDNLLLARDPDSDGNYAGQICDLGSCQELASEQLWCGVTTLSHRPPEHFLGYARDAKCDLWSFGCAIYYLITGTDLVDQHKMTGYWLTPDYYADCHNLKAVTDSLLGNVCPVTLLEGSPNPDLVEFLEGVEIDWKAPADHAASCWWDRIKVASKIDNEEGQSRIRTDPAEYAEQVFGSREAIEQLLNGLLAIDPDQRLSAKDVLELPMFDEYRELITRVRKAHPGIQIPCVRPQTLSPEIGVHKVLALITQHVSKLEHPTPSQLMAYSAVIPILSRAYSINPTVYPARKDVICLTLCAMAIAHKRFAKTQVPHRSYLQACRPETYDIAMPVLLQMERDLVNALAGTIGDVTLLSWAECHLDAEEAINLIRQRATELVPAE